MRSTFDVAYNSVLPAWQWFLAHTQGKPVVLVGDSQGSAVLIHLISAELDHEPSVLSRLLVAVLVGGNLQVPPGRRSAPPSPRSPCAPPAPRPGARSPFPLIPSQPPADAVFGRPGQGVSLQSGQTAKAGQQVACTNPAALGGGTADLDPYVLTQPGPAPGSPSMSPPPGSPTPASIRRAVSKAGGATWLQVTSLAGASHTRPVVNDKVVGNYGGGTGPAWGYHGYEYGLTLGNLLQDIAGEEAAWESRH